MSVMPGISYRPLNQFSNQGAKPRLGVILHVNDSQGDSLTSVSGDTLYNWIASNPSRPNNQMSCTWQVSQTGGIEQYIDTDNGPWTQSDGNDTYLSIETEGRPADAMTVAQLQACARIMMWVHTEHGIPLVLAEQPGQPGLGWHGMGGDAWGGHPNCPGAPRKSQRAAILAIAKGRSIPTQEDDMTPLQASQLSQIFDQLSKEANANYAIGKQVVPAVIAMRAQLTQQAQDIADIKTALSILTKGIPV